MICSWDTEFSKLHNNEFKKYIRIKIFEKNRKTLFLKRLTKCDIKKKIIWINYGQLGRVKDLWSFQYLWGTGGSTESSLLTWHSHQEDLNHPDGWVVGRAFPRWEFPHREIGKTFLWFDYLGRIDLLVQKNSAYRLLFLEDDCCPHPHSRETTQRLALPVGLFSCINKSAFLIQMLLTVGVSPSENTAHLTLAFLYI